MGAWKHPPGTLLWLSLVAFVFFGLIVLCMLPTFDVRSFPRHAFASNLNLTEEDCRCCHAQGVPDRHHLLVETALLECTDCHELVWDEASQKYDVLVTRDCLICHSDSLADRHHVLTEHADYECLSCHAVELDPETGEYFIDFIDGCQPSDPPPGCNGQSSCAASFSAEHYDKMVAANDCTACHLNNLTDEHDKACHVCHQSTDPLVLGSISSGNKDCLACHPATIHSMGCQICHGSEHSSGSDPPHEVHSRHTNRVSCGVCHMVPLTTTLEPTGQYCATCHGEARAYDPAAVPGMHRTHVTAHAHLPYACQMCHGQTIPQVRADRCDVCHTDKVYDSAQLDEIHQTHSNRFDCTNCHQDPRNFALADATTSCLRCHDMRSYSSGFDLHRKHDDKQCWACHTSNGVAKRSGHTCESCHGAPASHEDEEAIHKGHAGEGNPCWVCHAAIVPKSPPLSGQSGNSPFGSLIGLVTDLDTTELGEVTIATGEGRYSTLTVTEGTYQLDFVSPGEYTLVATKAGYSSASHQVAVDSGQTVGVNFVLTASTPTWGAASVVGVEPRSISRIGNFLFCLLIPVGTLLLWKGRGRR